MISEKKELKFQTALIGRPGSSLIFIQHAQCVSRPILFILMARGAGVRSKTQFSDAISFWTCVTPISLLQTHTAAAAGVKPGKKHSIIWHGIIKFNQVCVY